MCKKSLFMNSEVFKKPKVVVFDMDGTLVESSLDFKKLKKEMGFSEGSSVLEALDEVTDIQKKKKLLGLLDDFEMEGARRAVPYEGVVEFLNFCDEMGFKKALLTRNSKKVTHLVLKKLNLSFGLVLHRDNLKKPKPHPMGLDKVSEFFKTSKRDIIFIGDHLHDLLTGISAGVRTFLFNNGTNDIKNWSEKADFVFEDYTSLKSLLEKSFK